MSELHLANLGNPWILARLSLSLCAFVLAAIASRGATRILAIPADAPADERALGAERDLELATTGLRLAFVLALASTVGTVLVAHRLAASVRGAMCASGVLDATPWGARALATSAAVSLAAAGWLGVRAVDSRLARGSLSRALARGALAVTAALAMDAVTVGRFLLGVDLRARASCCATRLASSANRALDGTAGDPRVPAALAMAAITMVVGAILAARARPSPARAMIAGLSGIPAILAVGWAAREVVAPFAFEAPSHRCAYCLLRGDEGGPWGWTLAGCWAIAANLNSWVFFAAWVGRRPAARPASEDAVRGALVPWLLAWALIVVSGWAPALGFRVSSGTWALFGGP